MDTPTRFDTYLDLLETHGTEIPELLETLPERRACLRALASLSSFFEQHPDVEMVGLDVDLTKDSHRITAWFQTEKGWMAQSHQASFFELTNALDDTLLDRPPLAQNFCLGTVFVEDPAGDFQFIGSQAGLEQRLAAVIGPVAWAQATGQNTPTTSGHGRAPKP